MPDYSDSWPSYSNGVFVTLPAGMGGQGAADLGFAIGTVFFLFSCSGCDSDGVFLIATAARSYENPPNGVTDQSRASEQSQTTERSQAS